MNPDSPADIRALLEERGLALKKRWGQNFLVNRGARERLVTLLAPEPGDTVWEIGPGLGSMTALLAPRVARLFAFEVDHGLCRYLTESLSDHSNFTLVAGDFLETWKETAVTRGAPERILGNLPYRSASLMIADIVEGGIRPRSMVLTVQRELAQRMTSGPGEKSYSSFSVLCQSCYSVQGRGDLKPGSFYPVPEVVSSIVEMKRRDDALTGAEARALSSLLRGLFAARRKTLRNNVGSADLALAFPGISLGDALEREGIDLSQRAEQIDPAVFVKITRELIGSSAP
jgi:16S rRNA (adenine1518-N6/adenine1519-N6)-dimethyltransferase